MIHHHHPHPWRAATLAMALLLNAGPALTHGGRVGSIEVTHPFATPTPAGATTGAVYLATVSNTGSTADRLVRVTTPIAERAELHSMAVDAAGVMRMREVADIALAPGASVRMRPGSGYHIMLIGLKQPLAEGDRFTVTLSFERAGSTELRVDVQVPRRQGGTEHQH